MNDPQQKSGPQAAFPDRTTTSIDLHLTAQARLEAAKGYLAAAICDPERDLELVLWAMTLIDTANEDLSC